MAKPSSEAYYYCPLSDGSCRRDGRGAPYPRTNKSLWEKIRFFNAGVPHWEIRPQCSAVGYNPPEGYDPAAYVGSCKFARAAIETELKRRFPGQADVVGLRSVSPDKLSGFFNGSEFASVIRGVLKTPENKK